MLNEKDEQRIREISTFLEVTPKGVGRPIEDRAAWEEMVKRNDYYKVVKEAEELLEKEMPQLTDELFLRFTTIGDRQACDKVNHERIQRIDIFTQAECIENSGRFLKAYEESVRSICSQKTWVMTAHDQQLDNFYGRDITLDLGSTMLSWELATADYLLGNRVNREIRLLIKENIQKRILEPFKAMVIGEKTPDWWLTTTNNWNAVCLAGVVGTAITLVESREERAIYIAAYEKYIRNYLEGFTNDGYCSEGLGYWGYGFSHFIYGAEIVRQATAGHIDLFNDKKVKSAALFGLRTEVINSIYPSIADCGFGKKPLLDNMYFISKRYGLGLKSWEENKSVFSFSRSLYAIMQIYFMDESANDKYSLEENKDEKMRSWFAEAGVLVCRPGSEVDCQMGAVLKGGHNNEHHNHNDLGNFIVVIDRSQLIVDPGSTVYTSRTFSKDRYLSNILNSYGHSVPVIAGRLQSPYTNNYDDTEFPYKAEVVSAEFSDNEDRLVLDLKKAYEVESLEKLERKFIYSRLQKGALTVMDEFKFSIPQSFETALLTYDSYSIISKNKIVIFDEKQALEIEIESSGEIDISDTTIEKDIENYTKELTRISIKLKDNCSEGKVVMKMFPKLKILSSGGI